MKRTAEYLIGVILGTMVLWSMGGISQAQLAILQLMIELTRK